mmetsp:Transcript_5288/g.18430  ORF Transcript_5288/g.18430 Transcript_5288/m.18430 type:complete len:258 (-) Transcript_5288:377-1150(-)
MSHVGPSSNVRHSLYSSCTSCIMSSLSDENSDRLIRPFPSVSVSSKTLVISAARSDALRSGRSCANFAVTSATFSSLLPSRSNSLYALRQSSFCRDSSCARNMMVARPFTKPVITVCGMSFTSLPNPTTPRNICRKPTAHMTRKRYSLRLSSACSRMESQPRHAAISPLSISFSSENSPPWSITIFATTAMAPAAPLTMPGRPPTSAVMRPRKKVAYRPTSGSTPATNENATLSGTWAIATVRPLRISALRRTGFCR